MSGGDSVNEIYWLEMEWFRLSVFMTMEPIFRINSFERKNIRKKKRLVSIFMQLGEQRPLEACFLIYLGEVFKVKQELLYLQGKESSMLLMTVQSLILTIHPGILSLRSFLFGR